MDQLTCEKCGYTREVKLEDDEGREVSVEEYLAAVEIAGMRIVCDDCQAQGVRVND
jgi:hypothetical protein